MCEYVFTLCKENVYVESKLFGKNQAENNRN